MSQDKIGAVVRSLVATPKKYLGVVLDIANRLGGPDGEDWYKVLKAQLKAGTTQLPAKVATQQALMCQRFYNKYFRGLSVIVPAFTDVDGKVGLYIAEGLTCDLVYAAWTFNKYKWIDGSIDSQLDQSREARTPLNGSYLVRVKEGVEPDAEFIGKSAGAVDADGKIGITLLERLFLELVHYEQTGKHLDVCGLTLCSGSRYCDGNVPDVYLNLDGGLSVNGDNLDYSEEMFGIREAVLESL